MTARNNQALNLEYRRGSCWQRRNCWPWTRARAFRWGRLRRTYGSLQSPALRARSAEHRWSSVLEGAEEASAVVVTAAKDLRSLWASLAGLRPCRASRAVRTVLIGGYTRRGHPPT